jgi:peptidyl-prolyl cis-trans isomerase B (cyclophilin B)
MRGERPPSRLVAWRSASGLAACAVAAGLLLAGCGSSSTKTTTITTSTTSTAGGTATPAFQNGCRVVDPPPAGDRSAPKPTTGLDPSKTYVVTFVTTCGTFSFKVDQKQSPKNGASFVSLVKRKFFDQTMFHRIVPGFVIQGGDPTQSGQGGPGYTVVDTPPQTAKYPFGTVAMAKTGDAPPGSGGSQFFVMTGNSGLDPSYAIIGKVTSGGAVVRRIGKLGDLNDPNGAPTQVVVITRATVAAS